MKKQILSETMLTLAAALTITSAVAPATFSFDSIRVDVPFDFSDGQS